MLKPKHLPWIILAAGFSGLGLRLWLFACMDTKGLLPGTHPAGTLCFVLSALAVAAAFLCARSLRPLSNHAHLFPISIFRSIGCFAGAAGLLYAAVTEFFSANGSLSLITAFLGLLAAGSLGIVGIFRLKGLRPSFLFHSVVTVFLMLYTVCQCRHWSSEPQLQVFFFPLLGSVMLMLTGYYHAVLDLQKNSRRWFVFCSQSALFFCLLSLNAQNWPFYLCMALWALLDCCSLQTSAPRYLHKKG